MLTLDKHIEQTIRALAVRCLSFLDEDMGIEVLNEDISIESVNRLDLMKYTTMIGLGGVINHMFVMSFDDGMMGELTKAFVYGEIEDSEMEDLKQGSASEIANTIIGNAIGNFPNGGRGVTFTPPISVEHGTRILKSKTSQIAVVELRTVHGVIILAIVAEERGLEC